ncbi:MAG: zinc ribbon domain-containing protein [Firmicutes bacterium]|nr:zinc ribbon domain-containing protein [Bacillota bacterium]
MKCPYCEAENSVGNVFCAICGHKLPETNAASADGTSPTGGEKSERESDDRYIYKPKKKSKALSVVIAVVVIAAVAAVVSALIAAFIMSGSGDADTITAWSKNGEIYFMYNDKLLDGTADEEDVTLLSRSDDGSVSFYYSDDTVYVVKSSGISIVDTFYCGVASADGSKFYYVTTDSELYVYDVSGGKSTRVAEDVNANILAVSPDGATAAYASYSDEDDDEDTMSVYIYSGGKSSVLDVDDSKIPFAISNSAKYIYLYDSVTGGIYVSDKKGSTEKIAAGVEYYVFFNNDNTEMLFWYDGSTYRYAAGDEDKIKLSSSECYPLGNYSVICMGFVRGYSHYAYTCGIESFSETFYIDYEEVTVYFCDKYCDLTKIVSSAEDYGVYDDGNVLMYVKRSSLYLVEADSLDDAVKLASDVVDFAALSDGSAAYYINNDEELIYVTKDGEETKIADDAESVSMTYDDCALFITESVNGYGALYSSKNGGERHKISDDVCELFICDGVTFYVTGTSTYDIYAASSGANFSLVLEDCETYCE